MLWNRIGRLLRLLDLLRVPILTLILVASLGPIAFFTPAKSLFNNLLDASKNAWGVFEMSLGAFLLAYTAVVAISLVLYYGRDRFPDSIVFPLSPKHPLVTFITGTSAAVMLTVFVIVRTEPFGWRNIFAALGGFAAALALVFLSKLIQLAFTDPVITPHPPPYLVFPACDIPRLGAFFDRVYRWSNPTLNSIKNSVNSVSQFLLALLRHSGEGYLVDCDAPFGSLNLRSGHVFALSLATFSFLLYLGIGFGKRHITERPEPVPALAFVLLFLIVACWSLGALAFFFDRYRFPLLWALVILSFITAEAPQSDYFFRVETQGISRVAFRTPAAYLTERIAASQRKPINLVFVATPGGGIQAAAWTAQVLAGLDQINGFRESVAFISSVSGGSLGSVIYTASFSHLISDVAGNAKQGAIDEVAWGLTQPDVWRAIAPWLGSRTVDRGWALEEKWIAVNHLGPKRTWLRDKFFSDQNTAGNAPYPAHDLLLSDWAQQGTKLPALVLNSMLVESGQHVVFSTTRFPLHSPDPRGIVNFYDLYPQQGRNFDIRVATAARMSASFPFVAPAARPDLNAPNGPAYHFVDGGYYDNNGIDSLIGWLTDARSDPDFQDLDDQLGDILVLQIRHFSPAFVPDPSRETWPFQLYAPLSGLLSMWNNGPESRDKNELGLFIKNFNREGSNARRLWLVTIPFLTKDKTCLTQPLSWKLSEREADCVSNTWNSLSAMPEGKTALGCVTQYLNRAGGATPPNECQTVQ